MALPIIFSLFIIVITIIIHGLGSSLWLKYLIRRHDFERGVFNFKKSLFILSLTAVFFMMLHYLEIVVWAIVFWQVPAIDKLGTWEEAIYFSMVTYTTTGYGDITLPPLWRIMGGFEAMNGILLFGWSAAMFYTAVQKMVSRFNNKG